MRDGKKNRSFDKTHGRRGFKLLAAAALLPAGSALAQTTDWNTGSGNWSVPGSLVDITNNFTTFFGAVTVGANTTFNVNQATARFLAGFTNNGTYHTDPSTSIFTNATIGTSGTIQASTGDVYQVSGNLTNNSAQGSTWNTLGAELEFTGGGAHQANIINPAGSTGWATLAIDAGNTLQFTGIEGVNKATTLELGAGSALDLGDNAIVISDVGSPQTAESAVRQYIENGSILSDYANANGLYVAYADGSDSGLSDPNLKRGQIVIEPDLVGDTDLNGTVNIHDLQTLLSNFNSPGF
jgi:hypothetical protein